MFDLSKYFDLKIYLKNCKTIRPVDYETLLGKLKKYTCIKFINNTNCMFLFEFDYWKDYPWLILMKTANLSIVFSSTY